MASKASKIPLIEEEAKTLIRSAGPDVFEVPLDVWRAIEPYRSGQTFAVMGSANFDALKVLNGNFAFAGFDQLVAEANQKYDEPEGNAYHWVMAHTSHPTHPYLWCGPYYRELRTGHWFDIDGLNVYFVGDE